MTLLLFLFGGSTIASTAVTPTSSGYFTVSGSQVWGKFPSTTVVSTYAEITARTE